MAKSGYQPKSTIAVEATAVEDARGLCPADDPKPQKPSLQIELAVSAYIEALREIDACNADEAEKRTAHDATIARSSAARAALGQARDNLQSVLATAAGVPPYQPSAYIPTEP